MDFSNLIEDNRRELITDVLHRINDKLRPFHASLYTFLADLFLGILPHDWRERWHTFVAEQEAEGFTIAASSVSELEAWIEAWAKDCKLWPEEKGIVQPIQVSMPSLVPRRIPRHDIPGRTPGKAFVEEFDAYLRIADECFVELERLLGLLGQRLDAAGSKEVVELDAEVKAIDELIWRFYDARESAVGVWLRGNLPNELLPRLVSGSRAPPILGLPSYADPQQLTNALIDVKLQGERIRGRVQSIERMIFAMEVTETAGEAAGYLLLFHAAGTVIIKSTGKWAFAKGAAHLGVAVGGGMAVDSVVDRGLRAAGASEDTIKGARLAAAIVSFILAKKRMKAEADRPTGSQADPSQAPNPTSKPDENLTSPARDPELPLAPTPSAPETRTYSASLGLASSKNYRNTFFEAHPDLAGQVVVHHAIPQRAMRLYSGAISELELHSLENLRGIAKGVNPELHLSRIAREWNKFYRSHETATREQLIEMATYVDKLFGGEFLPPVGG